MRITLTVTDGPHRGQSFSFSGHDTFLVGRSRHAHFRLPAKDQFFSRVHFMIEVNPPACRLVDMGSHNGTYVNGQRTLTADLQDGDQIRAGHTILQLQVEREPAEHGDTISFHPESAGARAAVLPQVGGCEALEWGPAEPLGLSVRARRTDDGAPVSIKIVRPPTPATAGQIARFFADAEKLRTLDHPAIARLRNLGMQDDFLWFVYDQVPHAVRANHLARTEGPLPLRRVLGWTADLLRGLEHAHAQGWVHRDIRPSGILVAAAEGRESASWAEFGLARMLADAPFGGLSTIGDPESAAFWPPEFLTDYKHPTPAGDQYSLAAAIYWLLCGRFVFDMPAQTNRRFSVLLKQQVVPIRERRADVPDRVAAALTRALARHPDKRYPDLAAFRVALFGSGK